MTKTRLQIRWGWILACIVLGFAGIVTGFLLVAPEGRTAYVASVLAGVGTTLLLVGVVVLLERRIVDTAAKAVREAVDTEWATTNARIQRLTGELEERLAAEWAKADPADVDAMLRRTDRLTDEAIEQITDETNEYVEDRRRDAQ
ncbi:hypothetical protein [Jiangella anatolica]|uniref:Uncharacterized protein n=1 Tax=Jiangella anatolica TaxID=2670374 RepID=A0A2W2B0E4_9ACTN|nr:hypothetical protein [Jiangella anatolica]PZF80881.1 hypothetical protein C1I92_23905 [Jiangella anatolica]